MFLRFKEQDNFLRTAKFSHNIVVISDMLFKMIMKSISWHFEIFQELPVSKQVQLLQHCLLLTGLQAPLWLVWRQPTQEVMAFLLPITASGG